MEPEINSESCKAGLKSVSDAMYVLNGKWTMLVIVALLHGNKRFKDIERAIDGITPKMLAKELRQLELNEFVERKVYDTTPVQVVYELTPHSESLHEIIQALRDWGEKHRKFIMKKRKQAAAERLL